MIIKNYRTQIIQLFPEVRVKVAVVLFFIILSQCFYGQIYVKGDAFIYVKDSSFIHTDSIIYLSTGKQPTLKPVNRNSKIYILKGTLVYQLSENSNAQVVYVEQHIPRSEENPKKLIQNLIAPKKTKSFGNNSYQVYQYKSATESNMNIGKTENIIAVLTSSNTNLKKLDLPLFFLENIYLCIYSECSNTKIKTIYCLLNSPFLNTFRSRPPPYSKT